MIRGMYATTSSLLAILRRQEVLSQNLANISTPGFKQEISVAHEGVTQAIFQAGGQSASSQTIGTMPLVVNGDNTLVDYSQGPLENSQRPLDLAIAGDGFFQVQTPQGVRLTRDGTFHRDSAGQMVTADGYILLGADGPVQLGNGGEDPLITTDGSVYMPNTAAPVARIVLGQVGDLTVLEPQADNLFDPGDAPIEIIPADQTHIKQGFIEQANVDVSGTIVGMMMALRSYEATQRSLRLQDETVQRMLDVGRTA